jgi:hypothetical protein
MYTPISFFRLVRNTLVAYQMKKNIKHPSTKEITLIMMATYSPFLDPSTSKAPEYRIF